MTLTPYFSVFMYGDNDSVGGGFLSQNMVKVPNANCLMKKLLYAIAEWVGCVHVSLSRGSASQTLSY